MRREKTQLGFRNGAPGRGGTNKDVEARKRMLRRANDKWSSINPAEGTGGQEAGAAGAASLRV